jgi:hypothetical protein
MRTRFTLAAFVVALVCGAAAPGGAQAPVAPALPTGEAVIKKYIDATGGAAAYAAIKNRVVHGKMEIPAAGITLTLTVYQAKPNRIYTIVESAAIGRIESGVADGVVWENSAMRGALLKEGQERADALRDAGFDRLANWRSTFKSAECVSVEDVNGRPAYKVVLTAINGSPVTAYFDRESGLVVKSTTTIESQGVKAEMESYPSDYRVVDGIKFAFTTRVSLAGDRVVTVEKVEHNVELPADRFALPAAIKALVDAKKH